MGEEAKLRVELRPYQRSAVNLVVDALRRGKNVVLSMPTGSGKTLVALVAALKYSAGEGVSVFTRTLAEYQPWEREARRLGVKFSGHVGRDRVCKYGPREGVDQESDTLERGEKGGVRAFKPLLKCSECSQNLLRVAVQRTSNLDMSDWSVVLKGRLGSELEAIQRIGLEPWALGWKSKENGCGYPFAREVPTPIKLYTHLTYFLLWRYVGTPSAVYVFDEAHNLTNITRNLSFTLSYRQIAQMLRQYEELESFGRGLGLKTELRRQLDLIGAAKTFLSDLLLVAGWEGEEFPQPPDDVFEGDERLQRLISHLKLVFDNREVWRIRRRLQCPNPQCRAENFEANRTCGSCGSKLNADQLDERMVKLVPVDPSFLLRRLNSDRWIMLSGSMPNEWYLSNVLGLTNFEVVEMNPFEKNLSYFLDEEIDMSYQNRAKVKDVAIKKVLSLRAKEGVTLLVTQNYEEVGWFKDYADIVESPNTTILEVTSKIERRCEAGKPTLIASVARGKLIEGVEFKHAGKSAVSRVILLGVPFPNTQDEDFVDMAQYLKEKRDVKKWVLLLEDAAIASKQAIGRAIRGPEDSAEVFFLDKRFKRLFKWIGVTSYTPLQEPNSAQKGRLGLGVDLNGVDN